MTEATRMGLEQSSEQPCASAILDKDLAEAGQLQQVAA